jgi:hypothetical protein
MKISQLLQETTLEVTFKRSEKPSTDIQIIVGGVAIGTITKDGGYDRHSRVSTSGSSYTAIFTIPDGFVSAGKRITLNNIILSDLKNEVRYKLKSL